MADAETMTDDDGTLGEGSGRTITLEELRQSTRPMTVLKRVEQHALGKEAMSPNELQAAKLFLAKNMPDLKAVEVSGNVAHTHTTADALEAARKRAVESAQAGAATH